MSVLDRAELEQSPLADLHAIASELTLDGYRRLRKAALIDAILERQGGAQAGPRNGAASAVGAAESTDPLDADEVAGDIGAEVLDHASEEEPSPARRRRSRRGGRGRSAREDGPGDAEEAAEPAAIAAAPETEATEERSEPSTPFPTSPCERPSATMGPGWSPAIGRGRSSCGIPPTANGSALSPRIRRPWPTSCCWRRRR